MIGGRGEFGPTVEVLDAEFDRVEGDREAVALDQGRFGEVIDPRIPRLEDRVHILESLLYAAFDETDHEGYHETECWRCEAGRRMGWHERETTEMETR